MSNTMWINPTNRCSLRLTKYGFMVVKQRDNWSFHIFDLPSQILPKTLVQLERCFIEPYYIENLKTLHVMSERDAIMLALYGNDLQKYLDTLYNN